MISVVLKIQHTQDYQVANIFYILVFLKFLNFQLRNRICPISRKGPQVIQRSLSWDLTLLSSALTKTKREAVGAGIISAQGAHKVPWIIAWLGAPDLRVRRSNAPGMATTAWCSLYLPSPRWSSPSPIPTVSRMAKEKPQTLVSGLTFLPSSSLGETCFVFNLIYRFTPAWLSLEHILLTQVRRLSLARYDEAFKQLCYRLWYTMYSHMVFRRMKNEFSW